MAVILSLETSSKICSVAIHKDGNLLACSEVHINQSHAFKLAPLIEHIVSISGITVNELSAVAISSGPGSYTGLRIGTSTAKGLCYSLNIPLIAINTLELLAFQMSNRIEEDALLCPMIDARRMEVYCMVVDKQLNEISPIEAKIINEESFSDILNERKIVFFGDGAMKCNPTVTHSNAVFIDWVYPDVSDLGRIAFEKFTKNQKEDLVNFEPLYLKEFLIKSPGK